jgi:hypothetical protein
MSTQRFWVIGGEFRSLNFHQLVDGTQQVIGPFMSRREAEQAWRNVSESSRHLCNVRFMICQEPNAAASGSAAA